MIKNVSQVGNTCLRLWCGSLVVWLLDLTATIESHMLPHQNCKQMIPTLVYLTANCQSSEVPLFTFNIFACLEQAIANS